jgi:hypothetical protein
MPRNPIDYSKALIYKIEHLEKPELCYVGSTSNFVKRKSNHKNACNDENNNTLKYTTMRENGGWEAFKMVVIKEYPCNSKIELEIEEEKCRKELQANLNDRRCHRTEEEKKEYQKEYDKNYYEANKETKAERNKIYYENNKEKIAEKSKEKMTCVCGSAFRFCAKSRHEKTKKHCDFIK